MKAQILKNKKQRLRYKDIEVAYYVSLLLKKNNILSSSTGMSTKEAITNKLVNNQSRHTTVIKSYINKIRNTCLITGRPRAVIKSYKVSRHKFKELALGGYLQGIKKYD